MRILVTNWMDPENPHAGGAEVHLVEVFARLVAQGHQVTLISAGWPGGASRARVRGIEVVRVGSRWTFALAGPAAVRRALRETRFDVLVEDLNKLPLATPRWASIPVVVVVHHLSGLSAFRATWLRQLGSPGPASARWRAAIGTVDSSRCRRAPVTS